MRVICHSCQNSFTVPDTEAGKSVTCPQCSQAFTAPQLYAAPPPEPFAASPSAPEIATPPAAPSAAPPAAPVATPQAAKTSFHLSLNRRVCEFTVLAALPLLVILSFFKWDGAYPAGYSAYTQNAWQALGGMMSVDPVSEKVLGVEKSLSQQLGSSWWMLPYLIVLPLTLIIAWGSIVQRWKAIKLPRVLDRSLHYRPAILMAGAGLMLLFVLLQYAAGFGVPNAFESITEDRFKDQLIQAKTPEEIQRVEIEMAGFTGQFGIRTTLWFKVVILLQFILLLAVVGDAALTHRGNRTPPEVRVSW